MFNKLKNAVVHAVMGAPEAALQLVAAFAVIAAVLYAISKAKPGAEVTAKKYAFFGLLP